MERLRAESSILDFQTRGSPVDHYVLTFHGRGLWKTDQGGTIEVRDEHVVHVQLGSSYPRMMPDLSWRTPMFHPNISAGGHVCLGGYGTHWVPSVQLDELCHMLWDMIRYANYDIKSPYNREASQWARVQADYRFPLDPRPLRDRVALGTAEPRSDSVKLRAPGPVANSAVERIAAEALLPSPAPRLASNEVVFLGEVIEAELVADGLSTADDGITFLS